MEQVRTFYRVSFDTNPITGLQRFYRDFKTEGGALRFARRTKRETPDDNVIVERCFDGVKAFASSALTGWETD